MSKRVGWTNAVMNNLDLGFDIQTLSWGRMIDLFKLYEAGMAPMSAAIILSYSEEERPEVLAQEIGENS